MISYAYDIIVHKWYHLWYHAPVIYDINYLWCHMSMISEHTSQDLGISYSFFSVVNLPQHWFLLRRKSWSGSLGKCLDTLKHLLVRVGCTRFLGSMVFLWTSVALRIRNDELCPVVVVRHCLRRVSLCEAGPGAASAAVPAKATVALPEAGAMLARRQRRNHPTALWVMYSLNFA